jgi:hypothetical protein
MSQKLYATVAVIGIDIARGGSARDEATVRTARALFAERCK